MSEPIRSTSVTDASGPPDRRLRSAHTTRASRAIKARHAADRTGIEFLADRLTAIASSAWFLVAHVIWFGGWILWNSGALGLKPFDPFPFGLLTMIVSLEAIFLAIFVLMAQSREASIAELREEITLQVILRSEEEVTKTLQLVAGLYGRLGQPIGADAELADMLQPLDAERIERVLIDQLESSKDNRRGMDVTGRRPHEARAEHS